MTHDYTYSSALQTFEDEIGRPVSDDFSPCSLGERRSLITLFHRFAGTFGRLSETAASLPIATSKGSDYLVKRSVLYSANVIHVCPDTVYDEFFGADIPESYVGLLRRFHPLIRAGTFCIAMGEVQNEDLHQNRETERFQIERTNCAVVAEDDESQALARADPIHFKLLLPDVSGVSVSALSALMQDEDIFHKYHNTINLLSIRKSALPPLDRLTEIAREVDDKTRDLNSRFTVLAKKRRWQAIRSLGGLSLTGFTYLLPPEVASEARAVFGSLSALSIADGALGLVQARDELRSSPYYFSYQVHASPGAHR